MSRCLGFTTEPASIIFEQGQPISYVGTLGGTIHYYDYQAQKLGCKLTGHLANVSQLIKGPGNMLVSGAADTQVRVWDSRMKACIHTFKSHL